MDIQVRKLGIHGRYYDAPEEKRAYSYDDQPHNVECSKLGGALSKAVKMSHGDSIDEGLNLLKALQESGFGVFELDSK